MIGACLSSKVDNIVVRDEGSCFVVSVELLRSVLNDI